MSNTVDRICYVYEHYRCSDGKIFYVGIGTHKRGGKYKKYYRASEKHPSKRNPHWVNSVKKHGFFHRVVADDLSVDTAKGIEIKLISQYGINNLCNMTPGGDIRFFTKSQRERQSKIMKDRWANDEKFRESVTKHMAERANDPHRRKEQSRRRLEYLSHPGVKEKISKHFKKIWRDPRHSEVMSKKMKEKWNDQEYVDKVMNSRKGKTWDNKEYVERIKKARKETWSDPGHKNMMREIRKKQWQNPETRKKIISKLNERWANPEYRQKMGESQKRSWLKPRRRPRKNILGPNEVFHRAKLTANQVREIRHSDKKPKELASIYKMDVTSIRDVINRKTYKNVL